VRCGAVWIHPPLRRYQECGTGNEVRGEREGGEGGKKEGRRKKGVIDISMHIKSSSIQNNRQKSLP